MKIRYLTLAVHDVQPLVSDLSKDQFDEIVKSDQLCYGDAIIYFDEGIQIHIPFKHIRHMQPLSIQIYPEIKPRDLTPEETERFIKEWQEISNSPLRFK